MTMIEKHVTDFLECTQIAVIGTIDKAGRPRSAPIWFHWEEGAAYMFTRRNTLKWCNLLERPYASLCIDRRELPYASVVMDGRIEEANSSLYSLVLGMALRYYGEEKGREFAKGYRDNSDEVAVFRLVPRHIASFGIEDL